MELVRRPPSPVPSREYLSKRRATREGQDEGRRCNLPRESRQNGRNSFDDRARLFDAVNLRVLSELQDDPRLSMSELARRVGMSAPAVTERVQRLETAGVIVGYRVDIDPAALGLPVTALVRIRPGPG